MTRSPWSFVKVFVIVVFGVAILVASDSNFGFLWICSVRAAAQQGEPQKLVGGVVIGVYPSTDKRRVTCVSPFTLSPSPRPTKTCANLCFRF